eukprot:38799-Eustigmatos_ZCMA.PRE.1
MPAICLLHVMAWCPHLGAASDKSCLVIQPPPTTTDGRHACARYTCDAGPHFDSNPTETWEAEDPCNRAA